MRAVGLFVCCLLLTGGVSAAQPQIQNAEVGEEHTFNVIEFSHKAVSCHLTAPDKITYDFIPGQASEYERFELQPATSGFSMCAVSVKHVLESDSGEWELTLRNDAGTETTIVYYLNVLASEQTFLESLDVQLLNSIEYPTARGQKVDITLSKKAYEEECYLISPRQHQIIEKDLEGVTFQDSSYFVSCRVTLGPLIEEMLGDWVLCGRRTDNSEEKDRCQLVTISWYRNNNPDSMWGSANQERFNHVVNYGSTLSPVVQGSANRISCHVITPAGEDIILDIDSDYPNLKLQPSQSFICAVDMEIEAHMLGDWTLYGKFRDFVGIHEIRLPMNLFLYDENNPYDQAYNVTVKDTVQRGIEFGDTINLTVAGTGQIDSCQLETPSGEIFDQDSLKYVGVKFESNEESVACAVHLGPLSEELLGNWTVIGKFSNKGRFVEEHQTFQVVDAEDLVQTHLRELVRRGVNLGSILNMDVSGTGKLIRCNLVTPSGESYDAETLDYSGVQFVDVESAKTCRVALGPITEQLLGFWKIIARFDDGDIFTEEHQTFEVIKEDPLNPIVEDRIIFDLSEQQVTTKMSSEHKLTIPSMATIEGQSCHVRTPEGLQYEIMDGFNVLGVEPFSQIGVECGVTIHVLSVEAIGTWTLIARGIQRTELIERRLPFTINVEDTVDAIPKMVTIFKGNDLYVRLANPTEEYDTCKLTSPIGSVSAHVVDPLQVKTCGFIVMNVTTDDAGAWEISYGSKTLYIAIVDVSVSVESSVDTDFKTTIDLNQGQSVNMTVGPVTAEFCRLEWNGRTFFEGFSNCLLSIDSVTARHHGPWGMLVTTAGRVVAVQHQLFINVADTDKPVIKSQVTQAKPIITVSCSVTTDAAARGCKFRNPHGKVLLAVSTTAEDRYLTSFYSDGTDHECSLQITNPLTSDLGVWRCAIDTEENTHYGFVDVLCPFAMRDPEVAAAVQHEPILKTDMSKIEEEEGNPVTMFCSVNAAIRYCYFRASNGTTFAVSPGMKSTSMEYVGAGFQAGECGVTIQEIGLEDQGQWSCHVSLPDYTEQKALIQLTVQDAMITQQFHTTSSMTVEGIVFKNRIIEYCRYVRIDGYGFNSHSQTDPRYQELGYLLGGICRLSISQPTILDEHPWSVAIKVVGNPAEIVRSTNGSFIAGPGGTYTNNRSSGLQILLFVLITSVFVTLVLGAIGPKKNREWTYSRASVLRQSLRRSFRKRPLPADHVTSPESTQNNV